MTNIEFLVNELRKANETIANLRKENAKVKAEKRNVMAHNVELSKRVHKLLTRGKANDVSLGDIDALAALKKAMEENS